MSERTLVDELLDRWEEARSEGWLLSPEDLCEDHPELIATVRVAARCAGWRGRPAGHERGHLG